MNEILATIIAMVAAYFLGSIPFAYIITKYRKGIDIRTVGSKNMGAMNAFYTIGFWWGLAVLLLDIGKGALAVAIARWLGAATWGNIPVGEFIVGFTAVLGHSYTIFLGFKGGKGGATSIGVLAFLMPWGFAVGLTIFGILMFVTHFPTLSYSIALATFIGSAWFIYNSLQFVVFTCILLLFPAIKYIPRAREIYAKSGGVSRFFVRKSFKERL
jgi:acyl phosphate:glycerol-3-phosphate acyltransferase